MAKRAIDTNVLVRLLVDDHSEHAVLAASLAARFQLIVLPSVILETEWVLRSRYRVGRSLVVELLRRIIDFDEFIVIDRPRVTLALDAFETGMDFADAMHVSFTADGEIFVTFDRDLVRLAQKHIEHASIELAS